MKQRTALVTGANTGIGFETAKALAIKGFHVLLHSRTQSKGEAAKSAILAEAPAAKIEVFHADVGKLPAIETMAAAIRSKYQQLDVLVNNAGVWNSKLALSDQGIEQTLAINHLGYFYLTHLLYPLLEKAPQSRIICVASDAHRQIPGMFWDDLNLTNNYHGLRSYAQSKLANVLFVYEFARRYPGGTKIGTYAVQPGLVQTDIGIKGNRWIHRLAWRVRRQMKGHKTPAEGAATNIHLAVSDAVQTETGKYWDNCKTKPSFSSSYDEEEARRVWEWSCEVLKIKDFFQPAI